MRTHPRTRAPIAFALAVATAAAPFAPNVRVAVASTAEDKATARELAKQGVELELKGDCRGAIDKLEHAESFYHAPPHLQHLARCYTRLGRLVDAAETWRRLSLEALPSPSPLVFQEAVDEAKVELPRIEPRLGHLTIRPHESYAGLQVAVDGKPWPSAAFGVSRVIDPGKHDVVARADSYVTRSTSVVIKEGGSDAVEINLAPQSPSAAPTALGATPEEPTPESTAPSEPSATTADAAPSASTGDGAGPPWLTLGVVGTAVGGAMVAGGVITGLIASSKYSDLQSNCPNKRCTDATYDLEGQKSSVKTWSTATNVLLIGGGVLVAAGITTILLAPSPKSSVGASLRFSPLVGGFGSHPGGLTGGHVVLTGSF